MSRLRRSADDHVDVRFEKRGWGIGGEATKQPMERIALRQSPRGRANYVAPSHVGAQRRCDVEVARIVDSEIDFVVAEATTPPLECHHRIVAELTEALFQYIPRAESQVIERETIRQPVEKWQQ